METPPPFLLRDTTHCEQERSVIPQIMVPMYEMYKEETCKASFILVTCTQLFYCVEKKGISNILCMCIVN